MSAADIRHVIERVLQPLRFPDPYSDDYYFIQVSVKRNAAAREEAIRDKKPLPQPIRIPQPNWKDAKDRIRGQIDEYKQKIYDRSRDWETKEKVLGHLVRSQADRPKAQLNVPSLSALREQVAEEQGSRSLGGMDALDAPDDSNAGVGVPFSNRLWNMRGAVMRGHEALATFSELKQLMRSETASQDPYARSEILYDMDRSVTLLSQSVGIRLPTNEALTMGAGPMAGSGQEQTVQLEEFLVATIMQSAKGRKLLSRALDGLPPAYRWALVPLMLTRVLRIKPEDQSEEVRASCANLPCFHLWLFSHCIVPTQLNPNPHRTRRSRRSSSKPFCCSCSTHTSTSSRCSRSANLACPTHSLFSCSAICARLCAQLWWVS